MNALEKMANTLLEIYEASEINGAEFVGVIEVVKLQIIQSYIDQSDKQN